MLSIRAAGSVCSSPNGLLRSLDFRPSLPGGATSLAICFAAFQRFLGFRFSTKRLELVNSYCNATFMSNKNAGLLFASRLVLCETIGHHRHIDSERDGGRLYLEPGVLFLGSVVICA